MSEPTAEADVVAQTVALAVERLQACKSAYARQTLTRWWIRRHEQTARFPGSRQHAVAEGVLATVSPGALKAYRRAAALRRDDAA
ncbi:hypothetical protein ACUN7V_15445 [Quadrisphaera oryzae]|uniref:hypothetical protein n=1 Tax=Quadrisphaera TaxID=317661 RepID=UPI001645D92A|nr:hypothetical protein [Quadrisphaera sp. RL12-1S]MBC3760605.1 hypothetical protein [Quadrisphaera sp. RL12-1S]